MSTLEEISCYRLGRVNFSVGGHNGVCEALRDELAPIRAAANNRPDLRVWIVDELQRAPPPIQVKPVEVGRERYRVTTSGFVYDVAVEDGRVELTIATRKPSSKVRMAPPWLVRSRDWNYLSWEEKVAKNIFYQILDHVLEVVQLAHQQTFIHSSSLVSPAGEAVLVAGWGGVGKSSAVLRLVLKHRWRFLSDDLAVISDDGYVWRNPKKFQLYAYNLIDDPELEAAFFEGRSTVDRMAWGWMSRRRGPAGVRRRVAAETLFGSEGVVTHAPLTAIVFLERCWNADFAPFTLTPAQAASSAAATLLAELDPFARISSAVHSTRFKPFLPTVADLSATVERLFEAIFEDLDLFLLVVPSDATPQELTRHLRLVLGDLR